MLFHVVKRAFWEENNANKTYFPEGFNVENFIHLCNAEQLQGVLERYYLGQTDLLLLTIDEKKLGSSLIYEPSTNDELFPHLYGGLDHTAIISIEQIA